MLIVRLTISSESLDLSLLETKGRLLHPTKINDGWLNREATTLKLSLPIQTVNGKEVM